MNNAKKPTYGLETKIALGKHRGATIREIIEDDPSYLEWALDEIDWFELDDAAQALLERALEREDPLENIF